MRDGRRVGTTAAVAFASLLLAGCIPWFGPPPVVDDPARIAEEPSRFRGDRRDRDSLDLLRRQGAIYPDAPEQSESDEAVVRETLKVVPLAGARGPYRRGTELPDARTMILRRRPRAACVALGRAMLDPDPDIREGAAWVFGGLDTRNKGSVEPDHVPPWRGPERDVTLARLAALLGDPDRDVRYAAATELQRGIGGPRRPSWHAVLAQIEREGDEEVKDALLRLLATREAPVADRLEAARLHAPSWILASWIVEGTVVEANRDLLERAFERAGRPLRVAILKEAEDLPPPQPWLEGIVRLGLADPDEAVRLSAAGVEESVVRPPPETEPGRPGPHQDR